MLFASLNQNVALNVQLVHTWVEMRPQERRRAEEEKQTLIKLNSKQALNCYGTLGEMGHHHGDRVQ